MNASNVKSQAGSHEVIAAFDLGSNTIKLTVGRLTAPNDVEVLLGLSETVRLGQGLDRTGALAADRVDAALDALTRFAAESRAAGASRLIGVATEATRVATNGAEFLLRVRDLTGIEIHSITGNEEAELTFSGLDGIVDLDGDLVVADIGGASTELIISRDRQVEWSRSFPVGSGRLTDRFVTTNPPSELEISACREAAADTLSPAPLDRIRGGRVIAVGGTGEFLDRLIPAGEPRVPDAIDQVLSRLDAIPADALAEQLMIPEARARVLPAGIAIAAAVCDLMEPATFEAAQSGIRRGLLLQAFAGAR